MEKITKSKFRVLKSQDGYFLTQVNANDDERIFAIEICLPLYVDENLWTEWPQADKERWEEQHNQYL